MGGTKHEKCTVVWRESAEPQNAAVNGNTDKRPPSPPTHNPHDHRPRTVDASTTPVGDPKWYFCTVDRVGLIHSASRALVSSLHGHRVVRTHTQSKRRGTVLCARGGGGSGCLGRVFKGDRPNKHPLGNTATNGAQPQHVLLAQQPVPVLVTGSEHPPQLLHEGDTVSTGAGGGGLGGGRRGALDHQGAWGRHGHGAGGRPCPSCWSYRRWGCSRGGGAGCRGDGGLGGRGRTAGRG